MSTQDPILQPINGGHALATLIADQLSARIGAERFDLWFSDRDCIRHDEANDCKIRINADSSFSLQRIQSTFGQDIREVVDRVCGPHFQIEYARSGSTGHMHGIDAISNARKAAGGKSKGAGGRRVEHLRLDSLKTRGSKPPARRVPTLQSFCFGRENRLLKAGVDQLFERPGQFSPFFIYGPTGSGKSHLLEAITNDFRRRLKLKRCVFLSAEQFTSEFVGSLRGGTGLPVFRRKYRDLNLFAFDDIQFLADKRATLGEFQHTIDNLIRTGKQVIVTSDRPPIELGHLGNEISARLSGGLTCPVEYPDFEGRLEIVRRMCAQRKLDFSDNVQQLICEQLKRDVRRLSGAVNRLHAYSVSVKQKITPDKAQRILCDLFSLSGPNCASLVNIEQAVCDLCGVKPTELKSSSRQKRISSARMLAMYLSRQYTSSAFSEIGDYFGGRSHSTAIAAERKVARWIANDEGISLPNAVYPAKEVLKRIESNLRIG